MNTKLVQVRLGILGLSLLLLSAFVVPLGAQDIEGLNLTDRILLTLANSLSQEYQYGPKDLADIRERSRQRTQLGLQYDTLKPAASTF